MIRRTIKPERRADHGPVGLVYSDRSCFYIPGEPLATLRVEEFTTAKEAFDRAKSLLGHTDFLTPFIIGRDGLIWDKHHLDHYASDPLAFAAEIASITPDDLQLGPVDLHIGSQIVPRTMPTLRAAIEAAAYENVPRTFIMDTSDEAETYLTVMPPAVAVILGYLVG